MKSPRMTQPAPKWLSPVEVKNIVRITNAKYGVFSDNAVISIAKIESGTITNPKAPYNQNAYRWEPHLQQASFGVWQVLETTARDMGLIGNPTKLYNPYYCCEIAIKYMQWINRTLKVGLKREPTMREVLAAYNTGVGTVIRNGVTDAAKQYITKYQTALNSVRMA